MSDERRTQWNFLIGDDGAWLWKAVTPDGKQLASERSFPTLKDCTADAARNGYVVWKTEEERRREAGSH
jgi:hypothetical protein